MLKDIITKHKDKILINQQEKTAYILKELRKENDYLILVSQLKQNNFKIKLIEFEELEKLRESAEEAEVQTDETPFVYSEVLEELEGIIKEATQKKASDIHITSDERGGRVKIRVNGMLIKYKTYTKNFIESMMRAFYQNLKIAESNYVDTQYQSAQFKQGDFKEIELPRQVP